jgi:hypothetical protein
VNQDETYAGLKEMFRVYQQMQRDKKDAGIPEIDKLIEMDKAGKLEAHITDLRKKRKKHGPATQPGG